MKKTKRKSNVTNIKTRERQLTNMKIKRDVKAYFMMDDPNPCDEWKPARWYYDQYCLSGLTSCTFRKFSCLAGVYCDKRKMLGHTKKSGTSHYKLKGHVLSVLRKKALVIYGEEVKKAA